VSTSRTRTLLLACAATAGLVGAHVLDYVVAIRDPAHRAAILHATGHGYLSRAIAIAIAAAAVGLAGSVLVGFRHGRRGEGAPLTWRVAAARLCVIQVAAFVLLEIGERIAAGMPVTGLLGVLGFTGVALQIAIGCAAAALLVGIGRAARAVGAMLPAVPSGPAAIRQPRLQPPFEVRAPSLLFASALAARAPPHAPR
jgi:hypothetical protein